MFFFVANLNRSYVSAEHDASGRPFHTVGAGWLNARLANSFLTGDFSKKNRKKNIGQPVYTHNVDLRYDALFRNYRNNKFGQISHFLAPVKIRGGIGEMSGSIYRHRGAPGECFRFSMCGFWNKSASKATGVENRGHIYRFLAPAKLGD